MKENYWNQYLEATKYISSELKSATEQFIFELGQKDVKIKFKNHKEDKEDFITNLLKEKNTNYYKLGEEINEEPGAIRRACTRGDEKSCFYEKIAEALNVPVDYIAYGIRKEATNGSTMRRIVIDKKRTQKKILARMNITIEQCFKALPINTQKSIIHYVMNIEVILNK